VKFQNRTLIVAIFYVTLVSSSQAQTSKVEEGYIEQRNISYWSVETAGLDKENEKRRLALVINFKGHTYKKPELVLLSIALRRQLVAGSLGEKTELKLWCDDALKISKQVDYARSQLDAETPSINCFLLNKEVQELVRCQKAKISLGGIEVQLAEQQLSDLRQLANKIASGEPEDLNIHPSLSRGLNDSTDTIEKAGKDGVSLPIILYRERAQYTRQ